MEFKKRESCPSEIDILLYESKRKYEGLLNEIMNLHDILCTIRHKLKEDEPLYKERLIRREVSFYKYQKKERKSGLKDKLEYFWENLKIFYRKIENQEDIYYDEYENILNLLNELIKLLDKINQEIE